MKMRNALMKMCLVSLFGQRLVNASSTPRPRLVNALSALMKMRNVLIKTFSALQRPLATKVYFHISDHLRASGLSRCLQELYLYIRMSNRTNKQRPTMYLKHTNMKLRHTFCVTPRASRSWSAAQQLVQAGPDPHPCQFAPSVQICALHTCALELAAAAVPRPDVPEHGAGTLTTVRQRVLHQAGRSHVLVTPATLDADGEGVGAGLCRKGHALHHLTQNTLQAPLHGKELLSLGACPAAPGLSRWVDVTDLEGNQHISLRLLVLPPTGEHRDLLEPHLLKQISGIRGDRPGRSHIGLPRLIIGRSRRKGGPGLCHLSRRGRSRGCHDGERRSRTRRWHGAERRNRRGFWTGHGRDRNKYDKG